MDISATGTFLASKKNNTTIFKSSLDVHILFHFKAVVLGQ